MDHQRHRPALAAAACVLLLLGLGCNWISAGRPRGPNVLLVTIDTLRADHVGAYGASGVETPTLDALAGRGVLFEDAFAAVPLTLPSHASLLTGQYPPTHGVRHNAIFVLGPEAETLAERFQTAGYDTGAVVAAAVLDAWYGLSQGFDHYDAELPTERAAAAGFFERKATQVTDAAIDWLRRTDGPFFLWVHYYDPHASHRPPEPWHSRFAQRLYDGEIAYADHELGRLLAHLDGEGRLANTVVAVTSDHGEGLGQHGEESHSYLIYDSVLHVPLILAGPGLPAGQRRTGVVSNVALAPTLLKLAGLPPLARSDVAALVPAGAGSAEPEAGWAYAETLAGELDHGWAPIEAIRSDAFKYIRAPRPELYDVERDPAELTNLLPEAGATDAAVVHDAEARIDGLLAGAAPLHPAEIDAESRARIEALGYVVPTGPSVSNGADPKDVHQLGALSFQVLALLFENRFDECEKLAKRGLEQLPNSARLHDVLARLYIRTNRLDQALYHAQEAARLNPHWSDFHAQVAYVHLLRGELPEAVAGFEHTLEIDPHHAGAHVGAMWRLKLGGSIEDAERHAEQALAGAADWPAVLERVAEVWESVGQYERARKLYALGVERQPDAGRLRMRLAIQLARLGDGAGAEAQRAAAGDAAKDLALRNRLAIAFAAAHDTARAEGLFREVLSERPEEPTTRIFLSRLLRETGRTQEAAALVEGLRPGAPLAPPAAPLQGSAPAG